MRGGGKALELTISDLKKNEVPFKEADGALVSFKMHTNHPIMELADAMEVIHATMDDEAIVIWGLSYDDNMKEDCVKATVFISYSKQRRGSYVNNVFSKFR